MAHQHLREPSGTSTEEQTFDRRTESYQLIERVNIEENIEDISKRTDARPNDTELGSPKGKMAEATCSGSGTAPIITRSMQKATKTIEKEGNAYKREIAVTVDGKNLEIESFSEDQANKRARRRSLKGRMTESMMDEEVVKGKTICTRRQSKIEKRRKTFAGVEKGTNEFSFAANTSLHINQTDDDTAELNEEGNQEDIFVQPESQDADCNMNAEVPRLNLLCPPPMRLPFKKSSPLWEILESSQIFFRMPQQPHFAPLKKFVESQREGMAISLMVTFSNVVKYILKFDISDSDKSIEEMMDKPCRPRKPWISFI